MNRYLPPTCQSPFIYEEIQNSKGKESPTLCSSFSEKVQSRVCLWKLTLQGVGRASATSNTAHMVPEEGEQLASAQAKVPKDNFIKTGVESSNTQLKELPLFSCYLFLPPVLLNAMIQISMQSNAILLFPQLCIRRVPPALNCVALFNKY